MSSHALIGGGLGSGVLGISGAIGGGAGAVTGSPKYSQVLGFSFINGEALMGHHEEMTGS